MRCGILVFWPDPSVLADSTLLNKKWKNSIKKAAKIFFGPNHEDWGVYLGKYAEKHEEKKNDNRRETGLRSPEIENQPLQALGGGGGGFFGLGGPNHNALTQIPEKKNLPNIQSVWFLARHTLKPRITG